MFIQYPDSFVKHLQIGIFLTQTTIHNHLVHLNKVSYEMLFVLVINLTIAKTMFNCEYHIKAEELKF